jgi:hypothetical protein
LFTGECKFDCAEVEPDLKSTRPITIDMKDASMEEILQMSLKSQALTYFIQEKNMFIKKEATDTKV